MVVLFFCESVEGERVHDVCHGLPLRTISNTRKQGQGRLKTSQTKSASEYVILNAL